MPSPDLTLIPILYSSTFGTCEQLANDIAAILRADVAAHSLLSGQAIGYRPLSLHDISIQYNGFTNFFKSHDTVVFVLGSFAKKGSSGSERFERWLQDGVAKLINHNANYKNGPTVS